MLVVTMATDPDHHGMAYCRVLCDMVPVPEPVQCVYRGLYAADRPAREGLQAASHLRPQHGPSETHLLMSGRLYSYFCMMCICVKIWLSV